MLSSDHFAKDAYYTDPELLRSMGIKKKPKLLKDAIPTVFSYKEINQEKRRGAFEKRRRQELGTTDTILLIERH